MHETFSDEGPGPRALRHVTVVPHSRKLERVANALEEPGEHLQSDHERHTRAKQALA
jgi:hypothetical protein